MGPGRRGRRSRSLHREVSIAFTEGSCKLLKEAHSGDTWYLSLEILDLSKQRPNGLVTTESQSLINPRNLCC